MRNCLHAEAMFIMDAHAIRPQTYHFIILCIPHKHMLSFLLPSMRALAATAADHLHRYHKTAK